MAVPRIYAADNITQYAYDGAIAVAQYAFMYLDTDDAKPASSQADAGTEDLNSRTFAQKFIGVCTDSKTTSSPAGTIGVARTIDMEVDCVSAAYEVGDLLAVDEAASGTALENMKVYKTTDASIAIGAVCIASGTTTRIRGIFQARAGSRFLFAPMERIFRGAGVNTETLAGAKVLVAGDAPLQNLDPGGAGRNVDLPAVTGLAGYTFLIKNTADAAEVLTVRLTGGGATVGTPTQNESALFYCDGTTWHSLVGANN